MALQASYVKKTFHFGFEARTSRGLMKDKISWFIKIRDQSNPAVVGLGECGPLPGLSIDDRSDFEEVLAKCTEEISQGNIATFSDDWLNKIVPPEFPSIRFGLETALLDLSHGGKRTIFENEFITGRPIPINGLIWMGPEDFMIEQIDEKISKGFRCIKLKVGGLDFEREIKILSYIRSRYANESITLRLDANGAFKTNDALKLLHEYKRFDIQSIEQPVKPGLLEMEEICRFSPIPIALDEELIGKNVLSTKSDLLIRLMPAFIVLKPTLHGGFSGCREWITLAEQLGIGWWITSALESNIGLNAICQFTAEYPVTIPQGLGTGMIYEDNIPSPLIIDNGQIMTGDIQQWIIPD
jgi:O-succinylbenzoate synthase